MRTTIFTPAADGSVSYDTRENPAWEPLAEYEGRPLKDVRVVNLTRVRHGEVQLFEFKAGGHFVMHASPDVAHCQIVRGRGMLGLPDGTEIPYQGPELYVFRPGALHDWHSIEEDTILSVCLVEQD
jgi:quercetin dioxygenase-like cupin family protein